MPAQERSDSEFPLAKSIAWKCCVTCNHWTGPRRETEDRRGVNFKDEASSPCNGGGWDKVSRKPMDACSHYLRWKELE